MNSLKVLLIICLSTLLLACGSSNNSDDILGTYKFKSSVTGKNQTIEIKKRDSQYLIVLGSRTLTGTPTENGLIANDVNYILSEDKNTLSFNRNTATRISAQEVEAMNKAELEAADKKKRAKEVCDAYNKKTVAEAASIKGTDLDKYLKKVRNEKPKNCSLTVDGMYL